MRSTRKQAHIEVAKAVLLLEELPERGDNARPRVSVLRIALF